MSRTGGLLRIAGLLTFAACGAALAFFAVHWSAIYAPAAFDRIEALIDSGHTDDETFRSAIADLRRFHPGIALYAEGLAHEQAGSAGRDAETALKLAEAKYSEAAAFDGLGQAEALVRLAQLQLRYGLAARNATTAIDLLTRAYELGSRRAGFELGNLYLLGGIVERDANKAAEYFTEVADSTPEAATALATMLSEGFAVPPTSFYISDLRTRALWLLQERVRRTGATKHLLALARAYEGELGGNPEFGKALEWFTRASASGSREALSALAKFYAKPDTGLQDLGKARAIFEQLAADGDSSAMVEAADLRRKGAGGPVDLAGAAEFYARATELGSAAAEFRYAMALRDGQGVAADAGRSFELLERAAGAGNIGAAVEIGRAYEKGMGVERDTAKALDWYKAAATRGSLAATERVALAYGRGTLTAADRKQYLDWGLRALERGSKLPRVESAVGAALIAGVDLPQDRNRGFQLLASAANTGRAEAVLALARCYAFGIGVKQDAGKAVEWYERAAGLGRAAAYWELGRAYASGFGVPLDENLAYEYFVKAASNGYAAAMVDLGRMYITGFGAVRDPDKGAAWLRKAAELGNANAMIELANVNRERLIADASDAEALRWLEMGAASGSARADYVLGLNYISGSIVERDLKKAEMYLVRAAERKNAPAKVRLKLLREQNEASQ